MYKRVEMYIGFKCNNNCIFCVEYFRRKKYQELNLLSSDQEIIKTLSDYKQKGYNHVNILGGECDRAEFC